MINNKDIFMKIFKESNPEFADTPDLDNQPNSEPSPEENVQIMEITIEDILAKTPKADCKSVCKVDFKSGTTAKQAIQDEVNLWVKEILEGKIKKNGFGEWASYPQPSGMEGCIKNDDKDQAIKLANMKGDIRMGFHTDTGRGYQLGLWRKTVITLNTFKIDGHLQMVPSKAQITAAYDWAVKVLETK